MRGRARWACQLALHPEAEVLIRERMQDTAREQGMAYEPDRPDNVHRLNMGVFPLGRAASSATRTTRFPGFSVGDVHFVPGLSGHGVADDRIGARRRAMRTCSPTASADREIGDRLRRDGSDADAADGGHRSWRIPACKVFSLPSVDHPEYGRHIELGVKGEVAA